VTDTAYIPDAIIEDHTTPKWQPDGKWKQYESPPLHFAFDGQQRPKIPKPVIETYPLEKQAVEEESKKLTQKRARLHLSNYRRNSFVSGREARSRLGLSLSEVMAKEQQRRIEDEREWQALKAKAAQDRATNRQHASTMSSTLRNAQLGATALNGVMERFRAGAPRGTTPSQSPNRLSGQALIAYVEQSVEARKQSFLGEAPQGLISMQTSADSLEHHWQSRQWSDGKNRQHWRKGQARPWLDPVYQPPEWWIGNKQLDPNPKAEEAFPVKPKQGSMVKPGRLQVAGKA